MNETLLKVAVGIVVAALPGFASTAITLDFTGSSGNSNGIHVSSGGTGSIAALQANFMNVNISGAPDTADNGFWSITGETFTLSGSTITIGGTIGSCTGCSGTTNLAGTSVSEQIAYSALPTYTSNGSPAAGQFHTTANAVNINFGTPTSITDLLTSGSALYALNNNSSLGTVTNTQETAFIDGTGSNSGSGTYNYTANSQSFEILVTSASATPEPASFALSGAGILALIWLARRRGYQS